VDIEPANQKFGYILKKPIRATNSLTLTQSKPAARCKLESEMSFLGSSSRSTWLRLVFNHSRTTGLVRLD
jgi:hypothetical protein